MPAERRFLASRGGTDLWVSTDSNPWTLPLDALVIPASASHDMGQLGEAVTELIASRDSTMAKEFDSAFREPTLLLTPEAPVLVPIAFDAKIPVPRLIAATAEKDGSWLPANAGAAAGAAIELASRQRLARIAIPLLGSGESGMAPLEVAEEIYYCVNAALPATDVREITLVTLDTDAAVALEQRAHTRAQKFANDLPAGNDLLDIDAEVSALAEAILLREMEPPLVVGVLGGWGSGKSFVMHLMRERISQIRALPINGAKAAWGPEEEGAFPYVGHPYVITFDAWTYANADLWASLMQAIFRELSRQLTLEVQLARTIDPLTGGREWRALSLMNDPERMAMLEAETTTGLLHKTDQGADASDLGDVLWKQMQDLKKDQIDQLARTTRDRVTAQEEVAVENQKLAARVEATLEAKALQEAGKHVTAALKGLLGDALGNRDVVEALPEQLDAFAKDVGFLQKLRQAPRGEIVAFGAVLIAALLPLVVARLSSLEVPGFMTALVAAAAGLHRVVTRWEQAFARVRNQHETAWRDAKARVEADRESTTVSLRKETTLPVLEAKARKLEADEKALQEKIGTPAGFVSLAEFAQARLESGAYESKLGMMHQVQRDIAALSDCLVVHDKDLHSQQKMNFFPRGQARVILFIDDLDRCPPDQVVAVLEAVQLLVKTRLFVVVLGMDVRYVTRALEKRYKGILWRRGDPSGLDYIEKIIQIPYRMRPIAPDGVERFVAAQMHCAVEGPVDVVQGTSGGQGTVPVDVNQQQRVGRTGALPPLSLKALEFSKKDVELVRACCAEVELTPRSVKRIVNVYKLLKIIWHRGSKQIAVGWEVKRGAVMLLALAARCPEAMRLLLDELVCVAATPKRATHEVGTWLLSRCKERPSTTVPEAEWLDLEAILGRDEELAKISAGQVGEAVFNLVRSFSFLGDIGTAPDEGARGIKPRASAVTHPRPAL